MAKVFSEHMKGRQFAVGNNATVADFVLAYTLDWANEAQQLGSFPDLRAYVDRMYARPQAPQKTPQALPRISGSAAATAQLIRPARLVNRAHTPRFRP